MENKHHVSTPPFFLLYSFSTCSSCCQTLILSWQTWCGNSFLTETPSRSVFSTHPDSQHCFFYSRLYFLFKHLRSSQTICISTGKSRRSHHHYFELLLTKVCKSKVVLMFQVFNCFKNDIFVLIK